MTTPKECREMASRAREQAKDKPHAATSLLGNAREWEAQAKRLEQK